MSACRGCAYRVGDTCAALDQDNPPRFTLDGDGAPQIVYEPRPSLLLMRAANGPCGPEATLYRLVWWRRWCRVLNS